MACDDDHRMQLARLLGKAEARIQMAAERLESGQKPKDVAAFLREALRDLETPGLAKDGARQ